MIERIKQMFSWKRRNSDAGESCAVNDYTPTPAQKAVAREQEFIRDVIRARALQTDVDLMAIRFRESNEHRTQH